MHPTYVFRIDQAETLASAAKSEEMARIWRYIAYVLRELGERRERLEEEHWPQDQL
jgi:hypothetical protein